ncbi:UbiH/UbiF family hydroxylase [Xanthomonas arboricola pv. corylina]|uniref:UbiH/UbiF family hydroxylase n=1 Tax=Xanthomonas arboricola TaxID=56448 RepID=UPI000CEEF619|nr:UbiH/UbiF family hydroxylase [Xanthomonas arboricola]MDN0201355.1 UbiH/UbiF family hydroxylase [Xanthomonas arboricola pv. corylina]MDN0214815.1 UbiH/UbiF family hydroxylase [Xanthomonas arboricola pv. corylina]PPU62620.1 2-octaprenyl-3-methyl-6-methoxy-1,4-benzoquinol hydroxylase [Xanthomonas arboricola pv. corylina]CAE6722466.1 3-demethoxyubiquinol 3-hydroxylase [Xanthomonas arboricola pv. corylina]CAE6722496.1 3-demethoxyubiquinol 3-hydroxylase [Xanthomonas arboricola pv. corylina]
MSRRGTRDALIVGGGVVGAACALALADAGLSVALIEGREPARWRADQPDLRVYAFAADNAALLDSLGVWSLVRAARVQPYRRMRVWDAAGGGELSFDADTLGREQLGWIIEHAVLVDRLWAAVHAAGIEVHCPARVVELDQDAHSVRLDDGSRLEAALAIAADGAASTLRELAGLPVSRHAYAQRGVVAFVETEQPHQATAWQRFLTTGPLAFLPFADGRSSIVWTLPDAEAARVLALDDADFSRELTQAFAARLGQVRVVSARTAFPLQRQLVEQYVSGRVLTLGDAAHVVHPLAGQGVNLGLRDVAALRDEVRNALAKRADWAAPHRLQRWARSRRSENTVAAYGFDAINTAFSNDDMHLTLLRGSVLGLAGKLPPLVDVLWKRASGSA